MLCVKVTSGYRWGSVGRSTKTFEFPDLLKKDVRVGFIDGNPKMSVYKSTPDILSLYDADDKRVLRVSEPKIYNWSIYEV